MFSRLLTGLDNILCTRTREWQIEWRRRSDPTQLLHCARSIASNEAYVRDSLHV
jgi:hypothetical protein